MARVKCFPGFLSSVAGRYHDKESWDASEAQHGLEPAAPMTVVEMQGHRRYESPRTLMPGKLGHDCFTHSGCVEDVGWVRLVDPDGYQ